MRGVCEQNTRLFVVRSVYEHIPRNARARLLGLSRFTSSPYDESIGPTRFVAFESMKGSEEVGGGRGRGGLSCRYQDDRIDPNYSLSE